MPDCGTDRELCRFRAAVDEERVVEIARSDLCEPPCQLFRRLVRELRPIREGDLPSLSGDRVGHVGRPMADARSHRTA